MRGDARDRRRCAVPVVGLVVALALTLLSDPLGVAKAAAAGFRATSANPTNTMAASDYFSCSNTVGAASPSIPGILAWPLAELSGSTAADVSGNNSTGTITSGVSAGAAGPCTGDAGRALTFNGSSGYVYGNTKYSPVPTTQSQSIWFKTTVGGGALMGWIDTQTGSTANAYDRMIYLTDDGRLVFGVYTSTYRTIATPAGTSYLDGQWHHVAATLSPSGTTYQGMRIYVDGVVAGIYTTPGTVYDFNGYLRVGYDLLGGWPAAPTRNFFTGSLAFAVVFSSALSPAQVASVYRAAGGAIVMEGETLPVAAYSPNAPILQNDCCGISWRGGAETVLYDTGSYATWNFYVPTAKSYEVLIFETINSNFGTNAVAVDGTSVGTVFDAYSTVLKVVPVSYGTRSLTSGWHTLKVTVTGKNAASSAYYFGFDYLMLR